MKRLISNKTVTLLKDLLVLCEKDLAKERLELLSGKTSKKELNFMYSSGSYNTCKNFAKILKIKYNFLY